MQVYYAAYYHNTGHLETSVNSKKVRALASKSSMLQEAHKASSPEFIVVPFYVTKLYYCCRFLVQY